MIITGTCSWAEKSLIRSGEFYPKEVQSPEGRLKYYSEHFSAVEVDSTYYVIPDKKNALLWAQRTPENFIFHVKAFCALTGHGVDPIRLPEEFRHILKDDDKFGKYIYIKEPALLKEIAIKFLEAIDPLKKAGKLGLLVFQFPPWFKYMPKNLDYLLFCMVLMQDIPIAVEFRHGSWLLPEHRQSVFRFLRRYRMTYITADEPQYDSLATVPFVPSVTTNTGFFRFHGRNKNNWLRKGIETSLRYDYEYSDEELKSFIPSIVSLEKQVARTFLMFNNCHGASAIKNALRMKGLIAGGKG